MISNSLKIMISVRRYILRRYFFVLWLQHHLQYYTLQTTACESFRVILFYYEEVFTSIIPDNLK